jgi:hypothetical protein
VATAGVAKNQQRAAKTAAAEAIAIIGGGGGRATAGADNNQQRAAKKAAVEIASSGGGGGGDWGYTYAGKGSTYTHCRQFGAKKSDASSECSNIQIECLASKCQKQFYLRRR